MEKEWRPSDAPYKIEPRDHCTTDEMPIGWDEEPDPQFDRAGICFANILERIDTYERLLASQSKPEIKLRGDDWSDDVKAGSEANFILTADVVQAMKYTALGLWEELTSYGDLGRELAETISLANGFEKIEQQVAQESHYEHWGAPGEIILFDGDPESYE